MRVTNDDAHGEMNEDRYSENQFVVVRLLAWLAADGKTEKLAMQPEQGWEPIWHIVKVRRFLTPGFALVNGKIPSRIRPHLKDKFPAANL